MQHGEVRHTVKERKELGGGEAKERGKQRWFSRCGWGSKRALARFHFMEVTSHDVIQAENNN